MMSAAKAFTLIEVLVATALSAGLMMGVMAVVSDLGPAGPDDSEAKDVVQSDLQAVASCVAADVANALKIDTSQAGRIVMIGYRRLTGPECRSVHRPVRIEYRMETIGSRQCLIRYQQGLDVRTNQNRRRDLLYVGLEQMDLEATRSGQPVTQWVQTESPGFAARQSQPVSGSSTSTDGTPGPVTSRDQLNPYDQVRWNGLNFYIKYVSDEILIEKGLLVKDQEPQADETGKAPEQPDALGPSGDVVAVAGQEKLQSVARLRWELRLASGPVTLERTVWIAPEGGPQ